MPSTVDQQLATRVAPTSKPVMYQSWQELLFLHWRCDAAGIQQTLPSGLHVDTFKGDAWVAIVPFFMRNIRPWWFPAVPGISNFMELNVRTYVHDANGTPGVWFYSLNANQRLAVEWAKRWFHLPYHFSSMSADWNRESGEVNYRCHRSGSPLERASHFVYRPDGAASTAEEGSLEFFLVERYIMFMSTRRNGLASGQVCHAPYEVQQANVEKWDAHFFELDGLSMPSGPPDHALISRRADVDVFPIETLNA